MQHPQQVSTSASASLHTATAGFPMQQMPPGIPVSTTSVEVEDLKRFLATAPQMWTKPDDPPIRSYPLSNGEHVSCVFWRGKFFITGTDIVKILLFRFAQIGRPVLNVKKFEEGVFSDLRNLKPGSEAVLEEPRSEFLEFLFRHGCIRTQKKQKVFFWNCVPHESLFLDAIERDFKREGSLYHMNMMMNHTRYLQKQVAMMQQQQAVAAAVANYSGSATPNAAAAAAAHSNAHFLMSPQLMPNGRVPLPPSAFSTAGFNGNSVDPFLLQQRPVSGAVGKLPINSNSNSNSNNNNTVNSANSNAPVGMPFMATPLPQPQPTIASNSQFDPDCMLAGSLGPDPGVGVGGVDDPFLLSSYFQTGDSTSDPVIDSSFLINLQEY